VKHFAARIRNLYLEQRTPVAFILVALVTSAGVMDNEPLQLTAAIALLCLILQMIIEIDKKVTPQQPATWFPAFQEAVPSMAALVEERLRRGQEVRLRWIGVTHETGWPFSQNVVLALLSDRFGVRARLHVQLAILDPDGAVCARDDGPDADQIRATLERVRRFTASRGDELAARHSSLACYRYDHRPTWHALLVDEDTLFFSTCLPTNLPFAAPQGGVEIVRSASGPHSVERIRHFVAWFTMIEAEAEAEAQRAAAPDQG
jgi:hypothetical protein